MKIIEFKKTAPKIEFFQIEMLIKLKTREAIQKTIKLLDGIFKDYNGQMFPLGEDFPLTALLPFDDTTTDEPMYIEYRPQFLTLTKDKKSYNLVFSDCNGGVTSYSIEDLLEKNPLLAIDFLLAYIHLIYKD